MRIRILARDSQTPSATAPIAICGLAFVLCLLGTMLSAAVAAAPGDNTACVTIEGVADFTGAEASITIDIGGTTACTQYDRLTADTLNVEGATLKVRFVNSYQPRGGEVFDVLDWDVLNGVFGAIDLSGAKLPNGTGWDTSQIHTNGQLIVTGAVPVPDDDLCIPVKTPDERVVLICF